MALVADSDDKSQEDSFPQMLDIIRQRYADVAGGHPSRAEAVQLFKLFNCNYNLLHLSLYI